MLIEPPLGGVGPWVARNVELRSGRRYDLQGRSLAEISRLARRELLDAARRWSTGYRDVVGPSADSAGLVFLAGHQPQMVHPGIWLKNFILGKLAQAHGATAVNLVVDSDTVTTASLRVPAGSVTEPHTEQIAFDRTEPAIPFEEQDIEDRELFSTFGQRASERIAPLVADPLLRQYWPMVLERSYHTENLGACLAQARHQLEGACGLQTFEAPQSQVCAGEAFQWFAAHLLAQLPRFQMVYNQAIDEYRRAHRLRSASHPAPKLTVDGPWREAPLWVWTADNPQRRRLFAKQEACDVVLSDRQSWEARLPLSPDADASVAVAKLLELQAAGVKLRSRALLTTLWARLALGDLFIHGIGGAKYDEVTDLIIERFCGIEPPGFVVVSGTLFLPIGARSKDGPQGRESDLIGASTDPREDAFPEPRTDATPREQLRAAQQGLRELIYHPERFIDGIEDVPRDVVVAKQRWIQTPQTRANARQRCQAIRQANAALQPCLADRRRQLLQSQSQAARRFEAEKVLTWREYAFCLYPEAALCDFLTRVD